MKLKNRGKLGSVKTTELTKLGTVEFWIEETQHGAHIYNVDQVDLSYLRHSRYCVDVFEELDGVDMVQCWFATMSEYWDAQSNYGAMQGIEESDDPKISTEPLIRIEAIIPASRLDYMIETCDADVKSIEEI